MGGRADGTDHRIRVRHVLLIIRYIDTDGIERDVHSLIRGLADGLQAGLYMLILPEGSESV